MLDIAIIGGGSMGSRHAAIVNQNRKTRLCAIVDLHQERCHKLAETFRVTSFPNVQSLLETMTPDAAIIATPASTHADLSILLSHANIPHLIEKPMATDLADAQRLADAARQTITPVWVGHLERFNPAVEKLLEVLQTRFDGQTIKAMQAIRCRTRPLHIFDVGVTFDLAVHDIDILLEIMSDQPTAIAANTQTEWNSRFEDELVAQLQWKKNDCSTLAQITSHWRAEQFRACLRLELEEAIIDLNYPNQQLWLHSPIVKNQIPKWSEELSHSQQHRANPLQRQLDHFADNLLGIATPLCSLDDGFKAVALAERLLNASNSTLQQSATERMAY